MNTTLKILEIGYTISVRNGTAKRPVKMLKSTPGNFKTAMSELQKLERKYALGSMFMWAAVYGYSVRVLAELALT